MSVCLVTGGAGFIGSNLVRALLRAGDRVRVLDNFSTGDPRNLADVDGNIEVLEGDIRDPHKVSEAVRGVDFVYHQAAMVSVPLSIEDPQSCFDINVQGTLNVLSACQQAGVHQVVLASSAAVYGETDVLPVHEDLPINPLSPYAASKLVNEIYAKMYTRVYALPVVSLRYFNVYGPRQSPDSPYAAVIPIFIHQFLGKKRPTVYGDGHQVRDFIFVDDVVRANLAAAEKPAAGGSVFNICTGQQVSLLDLLNTLEEVLEWRPEPKFASPRPGDIYQSYGDSKRAAETLEFVNRTSLQDGLKQTAEWMRR